MEYVVFLILYRTWYLLAYTIYNVGVSYHCICAHDKPVSYPVSICKQKSAAKLQLISKNQPNHLDLCS